MAVVNPKQIQYIKGIQPDFEFRVRKLQPSLDVASEDELFKVDDNTKPKLLGRQGSHGSQIDSSTRSTGRRSNNPVATPSLPSSSSAQTNSLPLEDRRLLARAKWLLKRLLVETEEEKQSLLEREQITDELDEHEEEGIPSSRGAKKRGSSFSPDWSHISTQEANIESILNNLLSDKADRKEVFFVLNILSFLKDGTAVVLFIPSCLPLVSLRKCQVFRRRRLSKLDGGITSVDRSQRRYRLFDHGSEVSK
jgi:hypothetical protein